MLTKVEAAKVKKYLKGNETRLSAVFDALSDANRCKLFRIFLKTDRVSVSDAAQILGISVSLTSQHIKVLESQGLLSKQKIKQTVYYNAKTDDPIVRSIIRAVL